MYHPKKGESFYLLLHYLYYLKFYTFSDEPPSFRNIMVVVLIRASGIVAIILNALHVVFVLKGHVNINVTEDFVAVVGCASYAWSLISFHVNNKKWSTLMERIVSTTRFGEPPSWKTSQNLSDKITTGYCAYLVIGSVLYQITNVMFNPAKCRQMNEEKGLHEICGTILPFWWPHPTINPYLKVIISLGQLNGIFMYFVSGNTSYGVPWECAIMIKSKIEHLSEMLTKCLKSDQPERGFKTCVQYHQDIIEIGDMFNEINRQFVGHLSILAAVVISFIGAQLIEEHSVSSLVHILAYTVGIFIVCRSGQIVSHATEKLENVVYEMDWYLVSPQLTRDVKFMLMRCQSPMLLYSRLMGPFDYRMFLNIIQTAYSYLAIASNAGT